jgi:hypothetical protein
MRNPNQLGCGRQQSWFCARYRRGLHKHKHRRESIDSTHGCTPHVGSIFKRCMEQEPGSALQRAISEIRAEPRVFLDPFGFIDRLDASANLNSGDENNETGKMTALSPLRTAVPSRDPSLSPGPP